MKNAAAPTRQHNPGQVARAAPLNGLRAMRAYFDFNCSHRRRIGTSEVLGNGMMGDPTPLFFANECAVQGEGARFSPNKTNNSFSCAGDTPPISGGSNGNFCALGGRGFARVTSTIKIVRCSEFERPDLERQRGCFHHCKQQSCWRVQSIPSMARINGGTRA